MLEQITPALIFRILMPIAALAGGLLIYKAAQSMGGELGHRMKILAVSTGFLALYGVLASFMEAGIQLFSYRDGAWSVIHILIHLSYTVTMLIGFGSMYMFLRGEKQ